MNNRERQNKSRIVADLEKKGEDYFDLNYGKNTPANYLRRLRRSRILAHIEPGRRYKRVLDAGCGPVLLYPELLEQADEYYAIDLVQENLELFRKNHPDEKIKLAKFDLDEFKGEGGPFDLIICSGSLEYTHHPMRNLRVLLDSLSNGGEAICSFPNMLSPYRIWGACVYNHLSRIKNTLLGRDVIYYDRKLFIAKRVRETVKAAHAMEVGIEYFGFKLLFQPLDIFLGRLDQSIVKRFEYHTVGALKWLCQEFLLICKKAD